MRTFNGLQIFTPQLTNSGQLDQRYVTLHTDQTITGRKTIANSLIYNPNYKPNTKNSPGISGQIAFGRSAGGGDFLYICMSGNGVGAGDWRACPLATDWS